MNLGIFWGCRIQRRTTQTYHNGEGSQYGTSCSSSPVRRAELSLSEMERSPQEPLALSS